MKLRTNLILTFLVASVLIAILGGITLYQINVIVSPLSDEIPNTLNQLTEASYLDTYALNIRYYDEILTQSARNFVFTQEPKWEERYNNTVELLNNEIENAIRVGDSVDKSFFDNISIANQNLIKLEQEAFLLVNNNEVEKAAKVLESEEYENYKKIYSQGLTDFSNRHETSHEDAIITTTKRISDISENTEKEMAMGSNTIMISIGIIIISSVFLGFFIAKKIVSPVNEISLAAKKISQGELDVKIPKGGFQESNELAHTLEQMIENIKKITDIEAQLALQKNLRKAMDDSSIVTIMNPDGIITHVNDKFCEISKYTKEEIIGSNLLMLRSTAHPVEYYDELWNTISKGSIWRGQICNRAKDGNLFWNKVTIIPFKDKNGKVLEYIAIRFDITEQIENENKSQKALDDLQKLNMVIENQSKKLIKQEKLAIIGELAARLSHDIRNPLSIIRVSLENLKIMHGQTETEIKHFDRVERAIDRITHQIEDVLGFVRKEPMRFEKVSISEVIADALDSVNIPDRIYFEISKNNFEFFCDKKRLVVAITNLILNGIQAITGKGMIKIECIENEEDVTIKVEDSGEGIPENIIDDIFEPLFTTKQQGTGLGLASVKSIIQGHDGTISVTSPPTIFTVILPKKTNSKEP